MEDAKWNHAPIKKEVAIRGRFAMLACDIEYCLLNIIMFCNPDPYNHERFGQFKDMKMKTKIDCAIKDIKKYKPQYYEEFKEDFDGLELFRVVRNDMVHNIGSFPNEPDLSVFHLMSVEKDENGIEAIKSKEYTEHHITHCLAKFARINGNLSALWFRLKREHDEGIQPFAHPSTRSE